MNDAVSRTANAAVLNAEPHPSETCYRRLFESIVEGILIIDAATGKIIDANPFMVELLGYSVEEFIGKELWEIGLFTDEQASKAAYRKLREQRYIRYENVPLVSKDGIRREIELVVRGVDEGDYIFIHCNAIDVTRRKQVDGAALRLAAIVNSSDDAIISKTLDGVITSWNPAAERIFGYKVDEAIGQPTTILFPPELVAQETEILDRIALGELVQHFDTIRVRKDGTRINVSVTISPLVDEDGKVVGASKIARDITGRKRIEVKLRESEEEFRTMVNSIAQLGWIANADGFIHWYNERWYDYTGTTPEAMEGWGWQSVHDPEVLPRVMIEWTAAIATGKTFEMEFPLRGKDGKFRQFLTRAAPFKDKSGKVVRWFGTNTDITPQKEVESALRKSEEAERSAAATQSSILNALPAHIALLDNQGIILAVNESWRRFGTANMLEGSDFGIGQNYIDICTTAQGDRAEEADAAGRGILRVLSGETKEFVLEYPCHSPTDKRWFRLMVTPLQEHQLAGAVVMHVDITESKLAEQELRKNQASLAAAQMRAKIGSWELDIAEQRGTWSTEMFRIFDRDPSRGTPTMDEFQEMIHPDDRESFRRAHAQAINDKHEIHVDFRVPCADGSVRWIENRSKVTFDSAGKPECMYGTSQDVTERKRSNDALRESEKQYRLLFENNPFPMWVYDSETLQFLDVNDAATYFYGYSREEFLSMTIKEIRPAEDIQDLLENVARTKSRIDKSGVWKHRKKDGSLIDVEIASHELDFVGKVARLVLANDVTEKKAAEDRIIMLNKDLEHRVFERTVQLTAVNEELEAFSYSVSHDLRAPLRHIDGFVRLLAKREAENLDATSARYLNVVSEAIMKMGLLIHELLAFSRVGRQDISFSSVDLNTLIADSRQILSGDIAGRDIKWSIEELPEVNGDPVLLATVITNLVSNAIKYTRNQADPQIEIGVADEQSGMVTIYVRDNGAGFDMQYANKLFGVFQRLHREEEFEGIGIGLATVQRIITRLGGHVRLEGSVGEGATFYFTLKKTKGENR